MLVTASPVGRDGTLGRNVLVGTFERWGQGEVIIKAEESKCLLLGAIDAFEKGKERLRV